MPTSDLNTGLSMSTSEGCADCKLTIDDRNTVSSVDASTTALGILIKPILPVQVTFNGEVHNLDRFFWTYPAPLRVEGQQADAVLIGVSEGFLIFFPLASTVNATQSSPESSDFFANITPLLGDLKDKDGKPSGKTITGIPVGQNWSLGKLAKDNDPYFTWVDASYERYVKYEVPCGERRIGWQATSGPRVVYMKKPATVSESDLGVLRALASRVEAGAIIKQVPHVFYYPPNAPCDGSAACAPKKKALGAAKDQNTGFGIQLIVGISLVILFCAAVIFGLVYSELPGNMFDRLGGVVAGLPSTGFLIVLFGGLLVFALAAAGVAGAFN